MFFFTSFLSAKYKTYPLWEFFSSVYRNNLTICFFVSWIVVWIPMHSLQFIKILMYCYIQWPIILTFSFNVKDCLLSRLLKKINMKIIVFIYYLIFFLFYSKIEFIIWTYENIQKKWYSKKKLYTIISYKKYEYIFENPKILNHRYEERQNL